MTGLDHLQMDLKAQAGHNHVQSGMNGLFTQLLGLEARR